MRDQVFLVFLTDKLTYLFIKRKNFEFETNDVSKRYFLKTYI